MITGIKIKNFAIIEDVEIEFFNGLNIITGETGAGKSIIIEAISLALGSRADIAYIRSGKEKAIVQMIGELDGEDITITREITSTGRNLCRLNGETITLSQLNKTCSRLADIHGQYDHQSLLDSGNHIKLLDAYKKDKIMPALLDVSTAYHAYLDAASRLKKLTDSETENRRMQDFMRFEMDEIRQANLLPEEDIFLEEKISTMQNSEKIYESLSRCHIATVGGDTHEANSSIDLLGNAVSALREISSLSEELKSMEDEYSDIYYRLQDLSDRTRMLRDESVFSQKELDDAIARLNLIKNIKHKHGFNSIEETVAYADALEEKLNFIDNLDEEKQLLAEELNQAEIKLASVSKTLSDIRQTTAKMLEKEILKELSNLNFKDAEFVVYFVLDDKNARTYTEKGFDNIEFLISTNRGEDLKPLSKIASGGEMSRIMLAFKKIIGDYDGIPTMIFDEIDAGISGLTASIVGKKLSEIAENQQVICITHLPQIAAFGENNYRISKSTEGDATFTTVTHLSEKEKIEEIARLVGGIDITDKALDNARELIEQSRQKN